MQRKNDSKWILITAHRPTSPEVWVSQGPTVAARRPSSTRWAPNPRRCNTSSKRPICRLQATTNRSLIISMERCRVLTRSSSRSRCLRLTNTAIQCTSSQGRTVLHPTLTTMVDSNQYSSLVSLRPSRCNSTQLSSNSIWLCLKQSNLRTNIRRRRRHWDNSQSRQTLQSSRISK